MRVSEDTPQDKWWYCLKHKRVEHGAGCPNKMRMGPYPDEATAQRALELARERTKAEDDADKDWGES